MLPNYCSCPLFSAHRRPVVGGASLCHPLLLLPRTRLQERLPQTLGGAALAAGHRAATRMVGVGPWPGIGTGPGTGPGLEPGLGPGLGLGPGPGPGPGPAFTCRPHCECHCHSPDPPDWAPWPYSWCGRVCSSDCSPSSAWASSPGSQSCTITIMSRTNKDKQQRARFDGNTYIGERNFFTNGFKHKESRDHWSG